MQLYNRSISTSPQATSISPATSTLAAGVKGRHGAFEIVYGTPLGVIPTPLTLVTGVSNAIQKFIQFTVQPSLSAAQ